MALKYYSNCLRMPERLITSYHPEFASSYENSSENIHVKLGKIYLVLVLI